MSALYQPALHHTTVNGLQLAHFEWHPELRGQGPTLLMVHATGFHGRVWDEVIRHLGSRHVLAFEQRGHGRSQDAPFDSWADFGRDLSAWVAAQGLQGAVGIGHSMGAASLVQAASLQPGAFKQVVLIDPTIVDPAQYQSGTYEGPLHPAAQRKNHFESAQAMFDRFNGRPPYAVFTPQALRDFCDHGLQPDAERGGYKLACAPSTEAKIYTIARHNPGIWQHVQALNIPALVVRARPQDPAILPWDPLGSPTWPHLATKLPQGRDLLLPLTHLMPMQDPAQVAQIVEREMALQVAL